MKTTNTMLIAFSIISIFFFSCQPEKKLAHSEADSHVHGAAEQKEERHHATEGAVHLDNGQLWAADISTTAGINKMKKIMADFSKNSTTAEYAVLKENLEIAFQEIFAKCTMTGESHNQLHNYLLPMKALFEDLGSIKLSTCKVSFDKMNIHLDAYSAYFN